MPTWTWLPAPKKRILDPALGNLDPDIRPAVEAALEELLADPVGFPSFPWKGADDPRPSRVAVLAGRVLFRYVVYKDFPLVGPVALVDLGALPEGSTS